MKQNKNFIQQIHPVIKICILIFLIVFIFIIHSFFCYLLCFGLVMVLWCLSKPNWQKNSFIIFSSLLMFCLVLLINWISVKTPNIAIFNFDKLNWWDSKKNDFLPFYPDSNFEYYLNPIWGCNFFGGNIDNSWGSFTSGDTFFIGNYSEAYKQASEHHAVGWDFMLLSVKENGHMIWRYIEYQNFWYTFSLSNVVYAGNITFKILLLLITITLFISSTDDVAMTYGITTLISPLKIFKLPVKEWGIIISLTIRFVPTLVEESKRILNAQASRGVDFKNGNFNDKAKAMTSLIIPMFLLSFIKSNELANAMQARNFTTDTFTTKYKTYNLTYKDFILLAFVFIYLGLLLMFVNQNVLIGNLGLLDLQLLYGV